MLLFTIALLLPLCFYLLLHRRRRRATAERGNGPRRLLLPPSPPGLPLLGHLHLLGSLPHRTLRSLARAHGPVLLLRFGREPTVVVSSAAAAEEVMRTRDLAFSSRPRSAVADTLLYGRDVAFAPYGEYWRQARRLCTVHLLSATRVLSFRHVREQEAAALVARVRSRSRAAAVDDLAGLLSAYANAVVSRVAFGDESARGLYRQGHDHTWKTLTNFQKLLGTAPLGELLPWLGWVDAMRGLDGKIRRTFEALDGMLDKVIEDHRRRRPQPHHRDDDDDDRRDFVDVLLDVHEKDEEHGIRLDTNEIKAIILDMFAAGTDTTSTAMEWAMAELVTHPRAMRKLQEEIRAAVGAAGSVVTEDAIHGLPYLQAVVKETLRLHVPIPLLVPREPAADAEILGYHVPAGTRVVINAWAIGRDPATWEDGEEFVPERFLDVDTDYRGQDMALVPFGAGRRGCPGVGFAEATIHLGLASLAYHFDWEAGGGSSALDMTEMNGLAVHIRSGLPLVATPWVDRPLTT